MKKILIAILIIFMFSMINLPNYIKPEKAIAASNEMNKKDLTDLDKALNTLLKLQEEYHKLDKSKQTKWVETKKKAVKKIIDNEIKNAKKLIRTKVIPVVQRAVDDYKILVRTLKEIGNDIDEIVAALDQCNKAMDEINVILDGEVKNVNEMNKAMDGWVKNLDDMNKIVDEMNRDLDDMQGAMDQCNRGYDQMNHALVGLNKATDETNANLKAIESNIRQMTKSVDQINSGVSQVSKNMKHVNNSLDKLDKNLDAVGKTKVNYNYHYYSSDGLTTTKLNKLNKKTKELENSQKNIKKIEVNIDNISHYDAGNLKNAKSMFSVTADLIPILSNIKGGSEAISGKDLITQNDLSAFDRTVAALSIVGGDLTKLPGKLAGTVSKANKTSKYVENSVKANKVLNSFSEVADYVSKHGKLPNNYITKAEAKKLGWKNKKGNLAEVAPGKSIGGDIFENEGNRLPAAKNRVWHEADINYTKGYRGSDRLLYSNDGLIYKTTNHYKTFHKIK
ncbi:ribonuclease domain-containing protein [Bacillus velezensis]|uniref:ribonuclease domain-containing protein n=1 Tax=Bacillus TaxID=1386 RepID=UPI0004585E32|nr:MULTISPECIES: ribonuclease domain-containing protein [Bacillus]AHZ17373.1 hypothetical protein V529_33470 [Bacillus velezensis SQR9]MDH2302741.1 ribonuclease domain-containing protein [Bacillus velezensis]MDR4963476.1 ribonuclease domain-containing protein [Bacillus velezensis]MEC1393210.1 ribonuclease domain-containing protein [Bacillus velezensis]MEC2161621.1 ribonuclease domain-containing protein [Bacillus velezensis]